MVKKSKKTRDVSKPEFDVGELVGVRLGDSVVPGVVVEDRGMFGPAKNHVVRISVQVTGSTATTLEVLSTTLTQPPPQTQQRRRRRRES